MLLFFLLPSNDQCDHVPNKTNSISHAMLYTHCQWTTNACLAADCGNSPFSFQQQTSLQDETLCIWEHTDKINYLCAHMPKRMYSNSLSADNSKTFVHQHLVEKWFWLQIFREINLNLHVFVISFCTLGQNESGVAVHNGRIYLVGGYSIWTNEPSACIQVNDPSSFWSTLALYSS